MKKLKNHVIFYDEVCPMCNVYTKAFVKTGMLDADGRAPYQRLSPSEACCIDKERAVTEIALLNRETGEVTYGVKSLMKILSNAWSPLRRFEACGPFMRIMDQFYKFISYNRRIIISDFMFNKIVLAGGTGYLGTVLANYYKDKTAQIIILSRSGQPSRENIHYEVWDGKKAGVWTESLNGADMVINLSGKNVNCRYNAKNKAEIFSSRTGPTILLGKVIAGLSNPPRVWLNLASATIYRHAEDRPQDEDNGEIGKGFSVEVCKAWEAAFWQMKTPQTRKVALRTGIVLSRSDGVLPRLINLVKAGLGGKQGSGKQYISWIHELDFARITEWLYHHAVDGKIYNGTASEAVVNRQLMRLLRKSLKRPFGLPSPGWLLGIGALIIGTETELILKSRWVYPKRLLEKGFRFRFAGAGAAIEDLLK